VGRAPRPTVLDESADEHENKQCSDDSFGSTRERPINKLQPLNHKNLQFIGSNGLDAPFPEKV